MAVKLYIEAELGKGRKVMLASLDVKRSFDAAFWPAILNGLRIANCPQNLYIITQDYFRERRAIITINSKRMEKNITEACPQVLCCGPGLRNI
jgi:hypothetical protein